jgi:translation initiation factor IF-2
MRVHELAKELGVTSDELLKRCKQLGMKAGNRLAGLSAAEAAALRQKLPAGAKKVPAATGAPKPATHAAPKAPLAPQKSQPVAAAAKVATPPHAPPAPPDKLKVPEGAEDLRAAAARKRRKGRGGSAEEDDSMLPDTVKVLGRYIPPSSIPRYPRRGMRRQHARAPRRPSTKPLAEKAAIQELRAPMSVKALSSALGIKANQILLKLMALGAMFTVNVLLDAEQMRLMLREFGLDIAVLEAVTAETTVTDIEQVTDRPEDLQPRVPVVTFLGHVDHGKTSLLDCIRKTDVAAHEYGGITQHIGANRVTVGGKTVVFLDTPGHEAFTDMRARGANVTDIAVLVVAADDGVMPQTEEAIDHARAANVGIVVAINKCDKPEANPTRVRQELTKLGLQPEEWGGDTVMVDVSAVTGKGVDELIEMLALVAELKELKANPKKPARATVLDAAMSGSRGPVATVLVQDGTLKVGDVIVCGAAFGRVKALYDDHDRPLKEAGPSWPVAVIGLTELPQAGDRLIVLDDLQKARAIAEERQHKAREAVMTHREHVSLENLFTSIEAGRLRELQLIVKGDVRGTIDALQKVLGSIVSPEVKLHVLRASVGAISTSDVLLADASDALVVGLNVVPDSAARALAEQKGVAIHTYNVIYRVKEEIERALSGMLKPEERETLGGHAEVRKVFRISRVGNVAGCYMRDGTVLRSHRVRLVRDGTVVFTGRIASLRREKDDIKEAREGFECGIRIEGYDDVKVGDVIESFLIEKIARTLGSPQGGAAAPASPA